MQSVFFYHLLSPGKKIRKMDLREFAKYPKMKLTYSWDGWSFEELKGYEKALHKNETLKHAI